MTAITAMASAPIALFALWMLREAASGDSRVFDEPWRLIVGGSEIAVGLRTALIADMLGYYLLLAPLIVYLYRRLRDRGSRLARMVSAAGFLYVSIGALGSAILAASLPSLATAWETASGSDAQAIRWIFETLTRIVVHGLNGLLGPIAAAVFWTGTGLLLKKKNRLLGFFSMFLGLAAALSWVGAATSTLLLYHLAAPVFLFGAPLWAVAMGLWIWRRAADIEEQAL